MKGDKMAGKSADACKVKLEGEWGTDQVADLKNLLADHLAGIRRAAGTRAELDLSALTALDACCCQLIAVFLDNMRRRGLVPVLTGMPEQLHETIALLGFSEAFAAPVPPGDESA